jgi:hypothetical protein
MRKSPDGAGLAAVVPSSLGCGPSTTRGRPLPILGTVQDEALPSQVVLPPELSRKVLAGVAVSKPCVVWRGVMARWRQVEM